MITIVGARNLRNADGMFLGENDCYCRCNVKGNDLIFIQTPMISSNNPEWNYTTELINYSPGQALEFKLYDDDIVETDFLGCAVVTADMFYPEGFDGEVRLDDAGDGIEAYLHISIAESNVAALHQEEQRASLAAPTKQAHGGNVLITELISQRVNGMTPLSPLPWPPPSYDVPAAKEPGGAAAG